MLIYRRVTGWIFHHLPALHPPTFPPQRLGPGPRVPEAHNIHEFFWAGFETPKHVTWKVQKEPEMKSLDTQYEMNSTSRNTTTTGSQQMSWTCSKNWASKPSYQHSNAGKHHVFCTVFSHHRRLRKTQRSGTSGACTDFKFHVIHNGARRRVGGILLVFYRFLLTKIRIRGRVFSFCLIQREGNTYINTIISI